VFLFSLHILSKTFFIPARIQRDLAINVRTSSCKVSIIIVRFYTPKCRSLAERSKTRVYGCSLAGITGSNPIGGMDVSVVVTVVCLSGTGLCDWPIPRPEESYRLWCVIMCDLHTSRFRGPWPALGCSLKLQVHNGKTYSCPCTSHEVIQGEGMYVSTCS
jgi:hypothetical protein